MFAALCPTLPWLLRNVAISLVVIKETKEGHLKEDEQLSDFLYKIPKYTVA